MAALGGGVISFASPRLVFESSFPRLRNIEIVLLSVIGGIGYVGGSITAGAGAVGGMAEHVVALVIDTKGLWRLISAGLLVVFVIFRSDGATAYLIHDFYSVTRSAASKLLVAVAACFAISLAAVHTVWTEEGLRGTDFGRASLGRIVLVAGIAAAVVGARRANQLVPAAISLTAGLLGIGMMTRLGDDLDLDGTWQWAIFGCVLAAVLAFTVVARNIVEREGPDEIQLGTVDSVTSVEPKTLTLEGLTVTFGNVVALSDAGLTVRPGEVTGLIGPNGAGKTTLVEAVTGFVESQGSIKLDGHDITNLSATKRSQLGIARSFQSLELFEDMTVLDNLRTAADPGSTTPYFTDLFWPRTPQLTESALAAIEEFELGDVLHEKPGELPYAKRRMVAIARALAAGPSIILLDEPAAGLDSASTGELERLIRRLAEDWGMAVLLIEHDVGLVMRTCDRVTALDFGVVIDEGTPDEISRSAAVIASYLGDSEESGQPEPGTPPAEVPA